MKIGKLWLTLGTLISVVVLVVGVSAIQSAQAQGPAPILPTPAPANPLARLGGLLGNVSANLAAADPETQIMHSVYSQVNPSVVSITVRMPNGTNNLMPPFSPFNQQGVQPYSYAAGSGFVYDTAGHIVTNAHVVDGADQIEITFSDGTMMHATLVGIDRDSDIAVIKANGNISHYQPVPLADSNSVQVGDLAIAIGNPFEEAGTMTKGIVSGLHRTVDGLTQAANSNGTFTIPDAIQTDAAVNPGNSGGPLLNAQGQVIGVNEQIASQVRQSSGVSFAIPANIVKLAADQLIKNGKVQHTWLGIAGTPLTLDLNDALHLNENTHGVYVSSVQQGSPAFKAGLQAGNQTSQVDGQPVMLGGDVIIAVDKQPVKTFDDLTSYLFLNTHVGQTITLTILRNGKQQDVSVTLAARPQAGPQA